MYAWVFQGLFSSGFQTNFLELSGTIQTCTGIALSLHFALLFNMQSSRILKSVIQIITAVLYCVKVLFFYWIISDLMTLKCSSQ